MKKWYGGMNYVIKGQKKQARIKRFGQSFFLVKCWISFFVWTQQNFKNMKIKTYIHLLGLLPGLGPPEKKM